MAATLTREERDALLDRFNETALESPLNVLTRRRFNELASLECDRGPVVSIYVDLSPQNRHNNAWAIDLKTAARDAVAGVEDPALAGPAEREIERMERWIKDNAARLGRGAALFSCPEEDAWFQVALLAELPTRVRIGRRPYLRPLARVRDEHDRFAVVSLDKQRARLFVSQLGGILEIADIFEDTPNHHKQGGWSQMRFQRHHDAHVMWHAGAVAHATEMMMDRFEIRHLLATGTPEVLAEYREHLSPAVGKCWDGEFGLPIDASPTETVEAIGPLQKEVEAREEIATIEKLNNSVSGGKGVWGLEDTLKALMEQRVMTLVVHDRFRAPGKECMKCRLVFVDGHQSCPACGGPAHKVEDVVDVALERAVTQLAVLELVRSDAARRLLPPGEPIGAVLRF